MRSTSLCFIIFLLCSCAKKPAEEVVEAIDVALSYLSEEKCDAAISLLEDVGRQNNDPVYLQVLASAYACRAGFSAISFITRDIPDIDTNAAQLYNSLSILSLSNDTTTDSEGYKDLRTALKILLDSGSGPQPSQVSRTAKFGSRKAGDIGSQILLLSIVQLGKFLNHYGNVDSNGDKGAGSSNTNDCFINYTYPSAQTAVTIGGGVCNTFNNGHPDLNHTQVSGRRRMCEGLMLVTNLIDVLDNIDISNSDSLEELEDVAVAAKFFRDTAIALDPDLATLLNMTSQSLCETTLNTASEVLNMQLIYASMFESGLQ